MSKMISFKHIRGYRVSMIYETCDGRRYKTYDGMIYETCDGIIYETCDDTYAHAIITIQGAAALTENLCMVFVLLHS